MGLLRGILTAPLAPMRATVAIADEILRQAERAYYDPAAIRAELEQVDRLRREGAIDEETAVAWEEELVERLMVGQDRTRQDWSSHG